VTEAQGCEQLAQRCYAAVSNQRPLDLTVVLRRRANENIVNVYYIWMTSYDVHLFAVNHRDETQVTKPTKR